MRRKNARTKAIEQALRAKFSVVDAYQYNSISIRVRIIDSRFKGKSLVAREKMVLPLIDQLPEDIQGDITILLTLAPGEEGKSMMNVEFEHPSPSRL
ncbi:MAG: hypothetical protein BIFFINMI_01244 [Phycisphaerae bacterium]|nr:hypothetical protein [Phycisphaerae bacterium]